MFPWIYVIIFAALLGSIWRLYIHVRRAKKSETRYLVIITADSQATIEWWIRSFAFWNWIHGKTCHCVCTDLGSTDDTVAILERLQRRYRWIDVICLQDDCRGRQFDELIPERLLSHEPLILDLRQPDNRRAKSIAQDLLS